MLNAKNIERQLMAFSPRKKVHVPFPGEGRAGSPTPDWLDGSPKSEYEPKKSPAKENPSAERFLTFKGG